MRATSGAFHDERHSARHARCKELQRHSFTEDGVTSPADEINRLAALENRKHSGNHNRWGLRFEG